MSRSLAGAFFASITAAALAAPMPKAPQTSLILVEEVVGKSGSVDTRRLLRVPFRDGAMGVPETIWEGDQRFLGHSGGHRILQDRYLVTHFGGVVDLETKTVILSEDNGAFVRVDGDRIVYRARSTPPVGAFAFDPTTGKVAKVADPEEGALGSPGVLSPHGTKSVVNDFSDELHLRQAGNKPRSLGRGFTVQTCLAASSMGHPPVLWLDDDRILTQTSNGTLVMVAMDGTKTPVASFATPRLVASSPTLTRDPSGRIIYAHGEAGWIVDVKAGKVEPCEWIDLGHGFEARWSPDNDGRHTIRYKGKTIGEEQSFPRWPGRAATADGHLALVVGQEKKGMDLPNAVRTWTAGRGDWATLKLWPNTLVGWITRK